MQLKIGSRGTGGDSNVEVVASMGGAYA